MGWNSNPSDGVSFREGTVTFPSNYDSEDKVYTLTYSDSGLTSNTFTVTVKHVTIQLEISSDAYLLDGKQNSNFTITYAKSLPDGTYTHEGLTLSAYTLSTDTAFQYAFSTSGITSSNAIYKRFTVNKNDVNVTKQMRFKCYDDNGMESEEILIEQGGVEQTILPDFDFLTFTFHWTSDDGSDLDTMTWIDDNHIKILDKNGSVPRTLDELGVGFSGIGNDSLYSGNTSTYIQHGGDNTGSGNECVLINFKKLCDRDWISSGVTKLYAYSFGNWFGSKKIQGNCSVSMKTYKGDGMQHGTDGNRYIFVPSGNTELVSDKTFNGNVYAVGYNVSEIKDNLRLAQEKNLYSKVFKFTYDIRSKSAIVENLMTKRSGRCVRIEYEYNGKQEAMYAFSNTKSITMYNKTHPYPSSGGTETISFNDSTFNIYENETKVDKVFSIIKITYYIQGDENYIKNCSYDKKKITLTIPPNISNTKRHFAVDLQYSVNWNYSTNKDFIFKFDYYQQRM